MNKLTTNMYIICKQTLEKKGSSVFQAIKEITKSFNNLEDDQFNMFKSIMNAFRQLCQENHQAFLTMKGINNYSDTEIFLEVLINELNLLVENDKNHGTIKLEKFFSEVLSDLSEFQRGSLKLVNPSEKKGFAFQYLLYIPETINHKVLLMEGNNGLQETDICNGELIDKSYVSTALRYSHLIDFFDFLKAPCFIPLIPGHVSKKTGDLNYKESFARQLSRNSVINDEHSPIHRLDLQILNAMEDAKNLVSETTTVILNDRVFLYGFSTSGNLASRLAFLHPEKFCGVCAGGINAAIPVPIKKYNNTNLIYPVGTFDYEEITGRKFPTETYRDLPKLYFMGENENPNEYNTVIMDSLHDPEVQVAFVNSLGEDMIERAYLINDIYRKTGFSIEDIIKVLPKESHNPYPMLNELQRFAKTTIEKENDN